MDILASIEAISHGMVYVGLAIPFVASLLLGLFYWAVTR